MEPHSLCVYQAHGTVAFVADSQAYFILSFQSDISQQIHTDVDSKLGRIFYAFQREMTDEKGTSSAIYRLLRILREDSFGKMSEKRGIVWRLMIGSYGAHLRPRGGNVSATGLQQVGFWFSFLEKHATIMQLSIIVFCFF